MASAPDVLLVLAGIIGVGYGAGRLAAFTRLPDVAMLLLLGLAVGPVNRALVPGGWGIPAIADALQPATLSAATPLISGFALVVILFEAGLGMDVSRVRATLGPAVRIALPVFVVTAFLIGAVGYFLFGMAPLVAATLGVALSNVGQTVSTAILRRMRLDDQTRAIGLVEMAVYDVVSVPVLVFLFTLAGETGSRVAWLPALAGFAQLASVSLLVGGAFGVAWVLALGRLRGHPHSYMLSLAALLAAYAITEKLEGAGAVSVLLFGLLIGNRTTLLKMWTRGRRPPEEGEEGKVQQFHEEITFLVRTVFFLFLGLSFTVDLLGSWPVAARLGFLAPWAGSGLLFTLGALLIVLLLPLSRALVIPLVAGRHHAWRGLIPVFGHGLGTAVLVTLPFVWHDYRPGTAFYTLFSPWREVFVNLAFIVILASVLGSSILVFLRERRLGPVAASAPAAAPTTASSAAPPPPRPSKGPPARPPPRGGSRP